MEIVARLLILKINCDCSFQCCNMEDQTEILTI